MTPEDIERKLRKDVAEFTQPSPEARAIEEKLRREVNELLTLAGWSTPLAAPRRSRPRVQPLNQPPSQRPESKPPSTRS